MVRRLPLEPIREAVSSRGVVSPAATTWEGQRFGSGLCAARFRRLNPAAFVVLLAALVLAGCKSSGIGSSSSDRIVQLNLITVPVALDLDGQPGVDGIAVKLYANSATDPKAIRIREGTIEFLMFDGTFYGRTNEPPVLRTFTFSSQQLRLHQFRSTIGYGYDFSLLWGTNLPTERTMSVGARYTAPDGRSLVSRPSSVTVMGK